MRTKRGLDVDNAWVIFKMDAGSGVGLPIYGITEESKTRHLSIYTMEDDANRFLENAKSLGNQDFMGAKSPSAAGLLELLTMAQAEKVNHVTCNAMLTEPVSLFAIQEVIDDVRETLAAPVPDKLSRVRLKIERAKQHIANLDGALRAFYDTKPYKVGTKRDPNTRKLIYYVCGVEPTPLPILYLAGDAIQNLRSALDHLAFQLWEAKIYCPGAAEDKVSFCIFKDAAKYKADLQRAVKGSRQDVIDALDFIEPCQGLKGHRLWMLHRLNNIDKHRELLTVGSAFRSVNLGAYMTSGKHGADMSKMMSRMLGKEVVLPVLNVYFRPADRLCPLKEGDELFIDLPDAEVNKDMDFRFEVALAEPQVVESDPLLETIHQIAHLVDQIIVPFGLLL